MADDTPKAKALDEKVGEWLETEGFPTEFRTANLFRKHNFETRQGIYVEDEKAGTKREVDVLASANFLAPNPFIRISFVVECKWAKDKPWVIFTSQTNTMHPCALVAQTLSSVLGNAVMWSIAGDSMLHSLSVFETPSRGGFGGRQAFTKGTDHFYSAIQSVVSNAVIYPSLYDKTPRRRFSLPEACCITFPVIILEGSLFEAYFDSEKNRMVVEPSSHVRCHWRGNQDTRTQVTVDIVSLEHLDDFIARRARDMYYLAQRMREMITHLGDCLKGKADTLALTTGPRGTSGTPAIVQEASSRMLAKQPLFTPSAPPAPEPRS